MLHPAMPLLMRLQEMPTWAVLATVAAVAILGVAVGILIARSRVRRQAARSRRVGREGAERALRLLHRAGYRVLDTEVTATGVLQVDGSPREYKVRADALVRRWFRSYVAEFKGGADSASPANRDTRRQLLEYALVFRVSGVLLVDADAGRIRRVGFPRLR